MQKNIIGVDLGATSGRVILARAGDDRLRMEELHRFPNRMREIDGPLLLGHSRPLRGDSEGIERRGRPRRTDRLDRHRYVGRRFRLRGSRRRSAGASARLPRSLYRRSAGRVFPYGASRKRLCEDGHSGDEFQFALPTLRTQPRAQPRAGGRPSMCSSCPMRCRTCLRANRCANIRSSPPRS